MKSDRKGNKWSAADGRTAGTKRQISTTSDAGLLEGDALAILVVHGRHAETFANGQCAVSLEAGERQRWRAILKALETLKQEIATGNKPAIK